MRFSLSEDINFEESNILKIDENYLFRESDRGCVLILAADIENLLEENLKAWMNNSSNLSKNDLKNIFDFTGPLGNFSSKIYLSKAIGLICSDLHSDLHKLRKIRNLAAHSSNDFSLSENVIKDIISSFNHLNNKEEIQRYSFTNEAGQKLDPNENVLKGYGFVSYYKSKIIIIVKQMEIKLLSYKYAASTMGKAVKEIRLQFSDKNFV